MRLSGVFSPEESPCRAHTVQAGEAVKTKERCLWEGGIFSVQVFSPGSCSHANWQQQPGVSAGLQRCPQVSRVPEVSPQRRDARGRATTLRSLLSASLQESEREITSSFPSTTNRAPPPHTAPRLICELKMPKGAEKTVSKFIMCLFLRHAKSSRLAQRRTPLLPDTQTLLPQLLIWGSQET